MTVRVLTMDGVTQEDHRQTLGAFMGPGSGALNHRQGIVYYPGAADLSTVSAMVAAITPCLAFVEGTSDALQGAYPVAVDQAVNITFDDGEAAVTRTDRVILQIQDDPYDSSGQTRGRVIYWKGQAGGAATALPDSSLLLWEVDVPAGASAGGGGINFAAQRDDQRTWCATALRIPVNDQAERDALPDVPGLEVTRLDTGSVEQRWSGSWRIISANPVTSQLLFVRKTADESVTSSTTLQDDNHLSVTVEANAIYDVRLWIIAEGDETTGDAKVKFVAPAGAAMNFTTYSPHFTETSEFGSTIKVTLSDLTGSPTYGLFGAGISVILKADGLLTVGGTGGTFKLQWAQNGSSATPTIFKTGSYMTLRRVA